MRGTPQLVWVRHEGGRLHESIASQTLDFITRLRDSKRTDDR